MLTLLPVITHMVTGETAHPSIASITALHVQTAHAVESSKSQNLHRSHILPLPHSGPKFLFCTWRTTDICAAASRVTSHRWLICSCKLPTCQCRSSARH